MELKTTWPKIAALIVNGLMVFGALLFALVCIIGVVVDDLPFEESVFSFMYIGYYLICALAFWIPTYLYSSPRVFLINCTSIFCCAGWIVALVFAIKDRKNPPVPNIVQNGAVQYPMWNGNTNWEDTPNQNIPANQPVSQNVGLNLAKPVEENPVVNNPVGFDWENSNNIPDNNSDNNSGI